MTVFFTRHLDRVEIHAEVATITLGMELEVSRSVVEIFSLAELVDLILGVA